MLQVKQVNINVCIITCYKQAFRYLIISFQFFKAIFIHFLMSLKFGAIFLFKRNRV